MPDKDISETLRDLVDVGWIAQCPKCKGYYALAVLPECPCEQSD